MKRLAIILGVCMATTVLGACGDDKKEAVAYRPIAYGQNNQCYYVSDPAEAQLLMDQGLCQRSWVPTVMPIVWHQMYYPYYSSPAYYGAYVPAAARTVYIERERSWGTQNKTAINREAKKATYQGSNGKTVTANKIGVAKYGAGNRFGPTGTKFGGGSRNATTPTPGSPIKPDATPAPITGKAPAPKAPAPKATPAPPVPKAPRVSPPPKAPSPQPKSSGGFKSGGSGGYGGGSRGYGGGGRR